MIGLNYVPLFIIIPLGTAFFLNIFERKKRFLTDFVAAFASGLLFVLSILMIGTQGNYYTGGWPSSFGITIVVDGLSVLTLITVNMIVFMATLFSINYMERYTYKSRFYSLMFLMLAGMNGLTITGDLFNMYVFLEIAAIASYSLVGYGGKAEELEASFKYLVMGTISSSFILMGIAFIYTQVSALNMAVISKSLDTSNPIIILALVFFIGGFGLKSAFVPFHPWLPDAHSSAPAPISAILSGVLIKSVGIYALVRVVFNIFGATPIFLNTFLIVGVLSAVFGVLLAIGQMDMKRLLAYHSISQIGYILIGIGLGTPLGILGGLLHFINHATFKSLLFLNSGAVEYSTGIRDLEKLGGLDKKMPVTNFTNLIASLSIGGIPPFNGFFSKLIILVACVQAGNLTVAIIVGIVSIITLSSFLKLRKFTFMGNLREHLKDVKEVPIFMKISMVFLSIMCILLGSLAFVPTLKDSIMTPAANVIYNGKEYSNKVLSSQGGFNEP